MCNYLASTVSLSRAQPQCQITVHPQEACRLEAQAAGAKSQGFLKPHAHLRVGWGARTVPARLCAGIRLPHGAQILFAGISLCRGYPPTLGALIFRIKHGVPHPPVSPSAELEKASRQKHILSGSVENHGRIFSDCLLKNQPSGLLLRPPEALLGINHSSCRRLGPGPQHIGCVRSRAGYQLSTSVKSWFYRLCLWALKSCHGLSELCLPISWDWLWVLCPSLPMTVHLRAST